MCGATPASAVDVADGFADTLVASVESPTALEFMPDGRLLVSTQFGELRIVQDGTLLTQPAFDLGSVLCTSNEQGLLGIAVDPAFASNGFVFVYYTRSKSGRCVNRVSRFTMSGSAISTGTEVVLVDEIPAPSGNHNGGDLEFGKDGYLYVSVGDGACDYAGGGCYGQNDAARDVNALVGKILRITSTGEIPPTNPFLGDGTARCNLTGVTTAGTRCQETFAWGLRNPFRMAFDPNAPGTRFFVNDVGDGAWEEIDEGIAGADYGWNAREGPCANGSFTNCGPPPAGMTNPVYAYSHAESPCHAITGGAFVPNGIWGTSYDNTYLYGDYTCGKIFQLQPDGSGGWTRSEFATDVGAVVNMTFGPSPFGRGLYYTNYDGGGQVRRIDYVAWDNRAPTAAVTADPMYGPLPLSVSFDGSGSSDPDAGDTLFYRWDFGDGAAPVTTATPTTSHTYTSVGPFTATLTVLDQDGASSSATVALDPGNTAPTVTFTSPSESDRFAVGESITLSATASDAEDGSLGPGNLSWRVLRHHDSHTHPFLAPTTGNGLAVTQPAPEDFGSGIEGYLEVQLTATDSRGLSATVTRNVFPQKVQLTFASQPSGRNLIVAGTTIVAPTSLTSWEGYAIGVEAPAQTDGSGQAWIFSSWSDGGAASHTIVTPAAPTTYTATFTASEVPPELVGAYGFEEASGTGVVDKSGRGNPGVISGATRTASGRFGAAVSFDGINDWVTVADSASLDFSTGMTLSAWVRPVALGGWRTVLFKERTGGVVYSLFADQAGSRPTGQVYVGGERNALGTAPVPLNAWTFLATTYDGSVLRLYVNGSLAASTSVSGALQASAGAFRIGGNSVWAEWFSGLIDEVRLYDRALSVSQIQADMVSPVGAPPADTAAPSTPSGLGASSGVGSVSLSWAASTDNVGVARYNVHRSTTSGFTPATANRVGQPAGTTHVDSGLAAGTYHYRVSAEDAAGNVSGSSAELTVVVPPDNPPTVTLTAPASGATVSGIVTVSANASDDVAVAGVTFRAGAVALGAEDTTASYSIAWDTRTVASGTYVLSAVARDSAGQSTSSGSVTVTVDNPPPPPPTSGLVAAFGFGESSGTAVLDRSGRGNDGVISGATRSAAGRHGAALSFDGVNDWVTVADSASLDLSSALTVSAWVRPAALGGWRTIVFKERPGGMVYSLFADQAGGRPAGLVYLGGERSVLGPASIPLNQWTHLATTYDGSTVRLFVNGIQAGSLAVTGTLQASTGALRLGGNAVWSEWFSGLIDEVRIYDRVLGAAGIQNDMQTPVEGGTPPPDSTPPTAPSNVTTSAQSGSVTLGWSASSDNVGVARYNVHRSTTAGFTPSTANRVGQPTGTSFVDSGLTSGTYHYRVSAEDTAGNLSAYSAEASAIVAAAPPPNSGLVAAYSFEEGSGTSVADLSGRGNSGVVSGATWVPGRYGSGLSFDGVDDWVTVADSTSLDLSSALTLSAWVRPGALGGWRTVLFKERSGGMVYALYGAEGGSNPIGQIFLGGERNATGPSSVPLDQWTHLAATSDGTTLRLYVDATLVSSTAAAGSLQASTGPLRIGGNSVWSEWFTGVIDEVRIYERALSAAEIAADMETQVS